MGVWLEVCGVGGVTIVRGLLLTISGNVWFVPTHRDEAAMSGARVKSDHLRLREEGLLCSASNRS